MLPTAAIFLKITDSYLILATPNTQYSAASITNPLASTLKPVSSPGPRDC